MVEVLMDDEDQVLMAEKVLLGTFQNSNLWNVMKVVENQRFLC
jgi:ABC-type histidine transport system ATPase subunit